MKPRKHNDLPSKRKDAERRLRQGVRFARILQVLQLIQGHSRWDAKAIATEIECSERTVYRDLQILELAGVPWYYDANEQCYRVRPDYRFPILNLTDEETLGQAVSTVLAASPGLKVNSPDGDRGTAIGVIPYC